MAHKLSIKLPVLTWYNPAAKLGKYLHHEVDHNVNVIIQFSKKS